MSTQRLASVCRTLVVAGCLGATTTSSGQHITDIMVQLQNDQLVTGSSSLTGENFTIPQRTFTGNLVLHEPSSTFRGTDPGFYALNDDIFPIPADELPAGAQLMWDILPMTVGSTVSNLYYWDGVDDDLNGLDINDVELIRPDNAILKIIENGTYTADASDQMVAGGTIATTAFDGTLHEHPQYRVETLDATPPAQGVYVVSLHLRMDSYTTSDPFFLAIRSPMLGSDATMAAADWLDENLDMLTSPPTLPGDYNGDGTVNLADYTVWRDTLGSTTDLSANGDDQGDSQGRIDQADYQVWKDNFGMSLGGNSLAGLNTATVPEPSSFMFLGLALCGITGRRFSTHRRKQKMDD